MKNRFSFILSMISLVLISCTTTKPLVSDISPSEVSDLKLLEPYCNISIIKKGNRGEIDDSLSSESRQLAIKVLEDLKPGIPLNGEIILSDSTIRNNLEKEFESLILTAERSKSISKLKITPVIDKVLEANNVRFGLITVNTGFTRIKGNYGKQVVKGAGLAILTLGMYYQTPIKAYSTVYAMIVDSKQDNISFFRKSFLQDREPLDESVLAKQYQDIFKGYFLPK